MRAASTLALMWALLMAFVQMTTAQTDASKTVPPAATMRQHLPRALWVWDASPITDSQKQRELWQFCAQQRLQVLYISVGDLFSPRQRETTDPRHVTAPQLAGFVKAAHQKQIEIEALDGDPSFALAEHHQAALSRLQHALDYNRVATPEARLDGWQWDIEPYLLPEFRAGTQGRQRVLQQFLDGVQQSCAAVQRQMEKQQPGLRLGYAISAFFDAPTHAVAWQGATKPAAFHLMDRLNQLPESYVAIMAYRDRALGANGTIAITRDEVKYAAKNAPRVRVWIGQETSDVKGDPPSITFWQEGAAALETAIGQINEAYRENAVVGGVAIHHWESYRALCQRRE